MTRDQSRFSAEGIPYEVSGLRTEDESKDASLAGFPPGSGFFLIVKLFDVAAAFAEALCNGLERVPPHRLVLSPCLHPKHDIRPKPLALGGLIVDLHALGPLDAKRLVEGFGFELEP